MDVFLHCVLFLLHLRKGVETKKVGKGAVVWGIGLCPKRLLVIENLAKCFENLPKRLKLKPKRKL